MNDRTEGDMVLKKNEGAAETWSSGGRAYDKISCGISEGIRHTVLRLSPRANERILDIATGTGLTARHIARSGARVAGVDIAHGLLEAARSFADEEGVSIDWRLGDAEMLPFTDASFDAAASTFGIMFATDQEAAIAELARVVRPGGRVAIAAWLPDSSAVALRKVVAPFMPETTAPPSPPASPFNWGDPGWLRDTLGEYFELGHEAAELTHRMGSVAEAWNIYEDGFGPIRVASHRLDENGRSKLRAALEAWMSDFSTDLGVSLTYQYLLTVGVRK